MPAALLAWARDRSGVSRNDLSRRFPTLTDWSGAALPTLKQSEGFASATHTLVGYFFLPGPLRSCFLSRTSGLNLVFPLRPES